MQEQAEEAPLEEALLQKETEDVVSVESEAVQTEDPAMVRNLSKI